MIAEINTIKDQCRDLHQRLKLLAKASRTEEGEEGALEAATYVEETLEMFGWALGSLDEMLEYQEEAQILSSVLEQRLGIELPERPPEYF